uniref:Neur_chan_memb domain-containing protein n=1 Tax=Panagrellus redivivus TaxID=6233 RepID=A0A7E4W9U6_PANRE
MVSCRKLFSDQLPVDFTSFGLFFVTVLMFVVKKIALSAELETSGNSLPMTMHKPVSRSAERYKIAINTSIVTMRSSVINGLTRKGG